MHGQDGRKKRVNDGGRVDVGATGEEAGRPVEIRVGLLIRMAGLDEMVGKYWACSRVRRRRVAQNDSI